jgi:hypothetical protein
MELEPVTERQLLGPLAVGRAEVADEARDDVQAGLGQRREERPRAPPADEAAGVGDSEALAGRVLEPLEVLRPRISSAIGSETATTASARFATSLATAARDFSFSTAAGLSAWRCACARSESRRSATHLTPVAAFAAAPIRCTDGGGEVVRTASIECCLISRIAAGAAVSVQDAFSSGTRKRRDISEAWRSIRSTPSSPCSSSLGFRPFGPR